MLPWLEIIGPRSVITTVGVTTHFISHDWKLQSFALTILKTVTWHYSDACAKKRLRSGAPTIGRDRAQNMVAAARKLLYDHMQCQTHIAEDQHCLPLWQYSGFVDALTMCRKIVGHFKPSPANTEELHLQQAAFGRQREQLIKDVSTMWNSSLTMITCLLRNQVCLFVCLLIPC